MMLAARGTFGTYCSRWPCVMCQLAQSAFFRGGVLAAPQSPSYSNTDVRSSPLEDVCDGTVTF